MDSGCDVLDIGLWGTEGVFATFAERWWRIMGDSQSTRPDYNGMSS